jgi:hypothetical protein
MGAGRREKAYLTRGRYCRIAGESVADDPAAGVIVGSGMLGYKVALPHDFISALLLRAARSFVADHQASFDGSGVRTLTHPVPCWKRSYPERHTGADRAEQLPRAPVQKIFRFPKMPISSYDTHC